MKTLPKPNPLPALLALVLLALGLLAGLSIAPAQQPVLVPWTEAVKPNGRLTVDWVKGAGVNLALQVQITNNSPEPRSLLVPAGLVFSTPAPGTQTVLAPRETTWETVPYSPITIVLPVVSLNARLTAPTDYNYTWSYSPLPPASPVQNVLKALAQIERTILPAAAVGVAPQGPTEVAVSSNLSADQFVAALASQWAMDGSGAVRGTLSNSALQYAVWSLTDGLARSGLSQHIKTRCGDWPAAERDRLECQIAGGAGLLILYAGLDPSQRGWPPPDEAKAALLRLGPQPETGRWHWAGPLFLGPGPEVKGWSSMPSKQWTPRLDLTNLMDTELTVWLKGPTLLAPKVSPRSTFACDAPPGVYRYGAKIPQALSVSGLLALEPYREYHWDYSVELPALIKPTTVRITLLNLTNDPLRLTVGGLSVVVPAQGRKEIELEAGTYHYEGHSGNITYRGDRSFVAGTAEWRFSVPK